MPTYSALCHATVLATIKKKLTLKNKTEYRHQWDTDGIAEFLEFC